MTQNDRVEIRQMLTDILSGHTEEMKGRYNVIHANLVQIKEQNTKTNGRVNSLETEVDKLKANDISRKSVVRFITWASVIIGSITGVLIAIIQLIIK